MSHQNNGHSVGDIYKGVINDVINQVREAFLDENVDIDILTQLKKDWEDKVNASGCAELEPRPPPTVPPPQVRAPVPMNQPRPAMNQMPSQIRVQPSTQQILASQQQHPHMQMEQRQQQMQYIPAQQIQQIQVQGQLPAGVAFASQMPGAVRMVQGLQAPHPYVITQGGQQIQQLMYIQQPNGQTIPVAVAPNNMLQGQRIVQSQQTHLIHHPMNQLDGNGGLVEEEPTSSSSGTNGVRDDMARKVLSGLLKAMQLDGGGGGMTDSSSDEEEVDDEDDPLRRIADRIGDDHVEDGDQVAEEDPLNSEDDQSDDEDLDTLFDAENVIMCQFEKVHRARTKWKFQLKDGIMHIENKDYCFSKCTGEAEW